MEPNESQVAAIEDTTAEVATTDAVPILGTDMSISGTDMSTPDATASATDVHTPASDASTSVPEVSVITIQRHPVTKVGTAEKLSQYMKEYSASEEGRDKTKQELLKHMIELLKPAVLRVRFEILDSDDDSKVSIDAAEAESATANATEEDIDQHENAHEDDQLETKFGILDNPNVKIGRVLITKTRHKSNFDFEIAFSANGIVLNSDTWDVIVSPVKAFSPKFNKDGIIANLGEYKIYKIRDGTTVNLYYYGDSWCISTANGYDVGGYRWMGNKTYIEALAESFYNLSRGVVEHEVPDMETVFKKLNKDNCYSLGFRHPNFHPFSADTAGVWMIRSFNTKTLQEESMDSLGFPQQIETSLEAILPREKYPGKSDDDYHRRVFEEIGDMNRKALDTFRKSNSNARKNKNTITESFNINYGFIIRGPFDKCGNCSNIVLESILYRDIRKFIYNQPFISEGEKIGVNYENRLNYSILRAYLNYAVKNSFITLFPQFDAEYKNCKDLVEEITSKVMKFARFGNTGNTNYSAKGRKKRDIVTDKVAERMFNHIKENDATFGKGGRFDQNNKKIVQDYVCNVQYVDIYFMILFAREA